MAPPAGVAVPEVAPAVDGVASGGLASGLRDRYIQIRPAKQSMQKCLTLLEELSLITSLPPVKGNGRGRPQVVYVATCCQTEELTEAVSL